MHIWLNNHSKDETLYCITLSNSELNSLLRSKIPKKYKYKIIKYLEKINEHQ